MVQGGHPYNHCVGKVIVDNEFQGFVEADFKIESDLGKYVEQGNEYATDHVHGLRKVSGKLTRGWGMNTGYIWEWFDQKLQKTILFQPNASGTKTYTCSGCAIKSIGSGIKAGSAEALMLDCDFEGLTFGSDDTHNIP